MAMMGTISDAATGVVRVLSETVANSANTLGGDPDNLTGLLVFATLCMFYMAWGIGANDCANNFATTWGSGALNLKQCIAIAAVCEFAGAVFLGNNVTKTFRKGMVDTSLYDGPDGRVLVMVGMTAVLFSAATWLMVASKVGLPVSTTHSAVGGVIAFGIITKGYDAVKWDKVGMIVASWFISPILSCACAFIVFGLLRKYVLLADQKRAFERTAKVAPGIVFGTCFVIALFVFYKGAKGVGLHKTDVGVAIGIAFGIAAVFSIAAIPVSQNIIQKLDLSYGIEEKDLETGVSPMSLNAAPMSLNPVQIKGEERVEPEQIVVAEKMIVEAKTVEEEKPVEMTKTEKFWCGFCWTTASFQALAHGGNDVANSVGPYAAVLAASEADVSQASEVPIWVFFLAGLGICLGLAILSKNVMETIGKQLTPMQPSKAFAAQLSATIVIIIATRAGIPISTTHASVGAVMGTGLAEAGLKGMNWPVMGKIATSWVVTLPIVGITASGLYGFMLPMCLDTPTV